MNSYNPSPHVQRAMADINESRNERQKCMLLCALGRHIREISRALVAETMRLRNEGSILRGKADSQRNE